MEIDNELSVTLPLKPCPRNKCRKKTRGECKRQKLKKLRHTPKELPKFPTCGHNGQSGKPYYCSSLTMHQIKIFHRNLYASNEKIKQDCFIIASCKGRKCKRSKLNKDKISINYFVTTDPGKKIRVCKTVFLKIGGLSRDRIERVMKNYVLYGNLPQENRGGDRVGAKNDEKKTSIKNFIESLNCVKSHYCRSQTSCRLSSYTRRVLDQMRSLHTPDLTLFRVVFVVPLKSAV
ncbi:hypothetical protein ABEB36_015188 [Hypothenemus hampei]|uniref:Uncharacterized protein n=1 Tax=Hypothenemus hampei TaxID=57062 RepID=A0ABD1E0Z3_HYPHA